MSHLSCGTRRNSAINPTELSDPASVNVKKKSHCYKRAAETGAPSIISVIAEVLGVEWALMDLSCIIDKR